MRKFLVVFAFVLVVVLLLPCTPLAADSSPTSILLVLSDSQGQSAAQIRVTPILNSLRAHKQIKQYEWLADANAFRIDGLDASLSAMLANLPGVSAITPANTATLNAARQAQRAQRMSVGRVQAVNFKHPFGADEDPVFGIHETWDQLQAKNLSANQAVSAVLKDSGGGVKATVDTKANADGSLNESFKADVVQGDYVEITYNSKTITIHSMPLTVNFDYANNHISGTANANHPVYVNVFDEGIGWCEKHEAFASPLANGAGAYTADFTGTYDVTRRTAVDVMGTNEEGNGWSIWQHAPWLILNTQPTTNNGNGFGLAPNENVAIDLMHGGALKENENSQTNSPDASFGFGLGQADMLPGDTLFLTENSNNWAAVPIVALNILLNPKTGKVTGQAPANQKVVLHSAHYNTATGKWEYACQTVTANASGNYSATFAVPYIGGDQVQAFFADGNGFEQQVTDTVPQLFMYKDINLMVGLFHANFDGAVNFTVFKKTGEIKYQGTGYAFGGWWWQLLAKNGAAVNLAANDKITVTAPRGALGAEANSTLTATVANVSATLSVAQNKVNGTAPKNSYLWFSPQLWNGKNFDCRDECNVIGKQNTGGTYSYIFKNDLVAGDYADVILLDAHGQQTVKRAYSSTPTITLNSSPATFRRGRPNPVKYTLANGQHVTDTGVIADSSSRPDWRYTMQNGPNGNWNPGGPGQ